MKRIIIILIVALMGFNGCALQETSSPTTRPAGLLSDQQIAAYSVLAECEYLVLADFEKASDLQDFSLARERGPLGASKIFYGNSPTATGIGSMGLAMESQGAFSLTFDTLIRHWKDYNLFLLAVFSPDEMVNGAVRITDADGKSYSHQFLLQRGWNKLQIDLRTAGRSIGLDKISRVVLVFPQAGPAEFFLDDLILVNYRKVLLGGENDPVGTVFAVQDGKRFHLGSTGRFELVFSEGGLIAWYDLSTDAARAQNLLPSSDAGIEILQAIDKHLERMPPANTLVNVHTTLSALGPRRMLFSTEHYFGEPDPRLQPDQTFTWRIDADGQILLDIRTSSSADRLAVDFAVAPSRGFEPVIGKLRNPNGPAENRIEYVLFRRMGNRPGADLLMAFKPWKLESLPVSCTVQNDRVRFTGEARTGINVLHGLLRVWPADIDHLGNAEIHVRKFLETPGPDSDPRLPMPSDPGKAWTPAWQMK